MKGISVIFRRECAAAFDSPIAYIFAIVFLLLTCGVFMNEFFLVSLVQMESYFEFLPFVLIVFVPTLSMRLWAEDRKHNTYELLITLPLTSAQLILGKYLASLFIYALVLLGSLPIVVMLYALGTPDGGRILASYAGALLFGGLILAFGQFLSGLTKDQIVAYLLTLMGAALLFLSGHELLTGVLDGLWPSRLAGTFIRERFSALPHYESFTRGIIDLRSLLYFVLLSAAFLGMNRHTIERLKR